MDYNESAHRVDKAFDRLFRLLDELESNRGENAATVTLVVGSYKAYKRELKRHQEEYPNG